MIPEKFKKFFDLVEFKKRGIEKYQELAKEGSQRKQKMNDCLVETMNGANKERKENTKKKKQNLRREPTKGTGATQPFRNAKEGKNGFKFNS